MRSHAVVVGAGPVGTLAALLLAKNNVSVTLIERNTDWISSSRASTFHPSTLDLLGSIDIDLQCAADAVTVDSLQWRNQNGEVLAEFNYNLISDLTKHPYRVHLEQQHLLDYLSELVSNEPEIESLFGTTVVDLDQVEPSVTVLSADGMRKTINADIVLGCDGANSTVRRLAGIGFPVEDYPTHAIRAYVKDDLTSFLPEGAPRPLSGLCYFRDKNDGVSLLRMSADSRLIVRGTNDKTDTNRLAEAVANATPWIYEELSIVEIERYRLRRGVVNDFLSGQGRVIVLGDAAHQTSTAGGFNMNSGIHDAFAMVPILADWMNRKLGQVAVASIANLRRDYLINEIIPRSERRVQGLQDLNPSKVSENITELSRVSLNNQAARQFLAESSLLDSPLLA